MCSRKQMTLTWHLKHFWYVIFPTARQQWTQETGAASPAPVLTRDKGGEVMFKR